MKKKIVLNKGELEKENFEKSNVILTNGPSRCDLPLCLLYLSHVIIKKKQSYKNKTYLFPCVNVKGVNHSPLVPPL